MKTTISPKLRKGQLIIILFLVLASLGRPDQVSYGQESTWSEPQPLSNASAYSWFPDVAADAYGNIHVVWASGYVGYDAVLYTTSKTGSFWSAPNDIFALPTGDSGSAATRPSLMTDQNSNLHISFVDLTTVYYSRVQVWNAAFAQSWLPRQAMNNKQTAYFSKVAIDSKNTLHYVFTENTPSAVCSNCYHVFYRQSTDLGLTWSEPVDLVKRCEWRSQTADFDRQSKTISMSYGSPGRAVDWGSSPIRQPSLIRLLMMAEISGRYPILSLSLIRNWQRTSRLD